MFFFRKVLAFSRFSQYNFLQIKFLHPTSKFLTCILISPYVHYSTTTLLLGDAVGSKEEFLKFPLNPDQHHMKDVEASEEKLPSVTRILQATKPLESVLALLAWKKRMIAELGEEGFLAMQQATLEAGSLCHSAIEKFLNGTKIQDIPVKEQGEQLWKSVQPVLKDISGAQIVEKLYKHPYLRYCGKVDCVAEYRKNLCVIDWKTSKTKKYKLNYCYDDPVQIAAYAGAINCSVDASDQLSRGLVVKIYYDGKSATALYMNEFTMSYYWNQWLCRLASYHEMQSHTSKTKQSVQ